jgi:macrodomain Ter protein organizer (MatP/YcbG family)
MSYMYIRDLEPVLWLQIAKSAQRNKRSLSEEALILLERGLAEKRAATTSNGRTARTRRRVAKHRP